MDGLYKPMSLTDRRASIANYDESGSSSPTRPLTLDTSTNTTSRMPSRIDKLAQTRPRGPPTPNLMTPSAELDSPTRSNHDPPRPPTPAASPGPECVRPDWSDAGDQEDIFLKQIRSYFKHRSHAERTRILGDLLNLCSVQQLSFVSQYVNPLLKKDPFTTLPDELCLRVCFSPREVLIGQASFGQETSQLTCTRNPDPLLHRRREDPSPCIAGVTTMAGPTER
jgi:F-box and WD-40 domain protein CDC4